MNLILGQAYSFHQLGQRANQEDARWPDTDQPDPSQRFFVVCDGVGGEEQGEVASQTVCETMGGQLQDADFANKEFTHTDFQLLLDNAYDALDRKAAEANPDMSTTMTFVCFHQGGATMAHIGDSRIYHVRPQEGILYRSEDHSLVNSMVHSGMLTPEQAIDHPDSNVITRYMSPTRRDQNRCKATLTTTSDIQAGDYFFLCTDGVLHCVSDSQLVDILSSAHSDEEKLAEMAAMSQQSPDNNTATLVQVVAVDDEQLAQQEPAANGHDTARLSYNGTTSCEVESEQKAEPASRLKRWLKNLLH